MNIELTILISLISVSAALFFGLKSAKRLDKQDIESKAMENAKIIVKLNDIGNDVKDIKYDISTVKVDVKEIDKRLIKTEESLKAAWKRIEEKK